MGKKREIEERIQEIRNYYPAKDGRRRDQFLAEILKELDEIRKLLEGPVD